MQIAPVPPIQPPAAANKPTPDQDPAPKPDPGPAPPIRPTLQDLIDIDQRLLTLLRMS